MVKTLNMNKTHIKKSVAVNESLNPNSKPAQNQVRISDPHRYAIVQHGSRISEVDIRTSDSHKVAEQNNVFT
jgi:hypothetical protein